MKEGGSEVQSQPGLHPSPVSLNPALTQKQCSSSCRFLWNCVPSQRPCLSQSRGMTGQSLFPHTRESESSQVSMYRLGKVWKSRKWSSDFVLPTSILSILLFRGSPGITSVPGIHVYLEPKGLHLEVGSMARGEVRSYRADRVGAKSRQAITQGGP